MRYFLIDKVTELHPGERAWGKKCVTLSDEILHDHFPDHPILPGALIVEAMAQLSGFLLEMSLNREGQRPRRALLVQIEQAKFHDTVGPGDCLNIEAVLDSQLEGAAQIQATAHVEERRVVRARLSFVMKDIPSERVHEQRRALYRLWTRDFPTPPAIL
jgi:3-hydroxyacyl-[acyl-carrier-protein] dehydratase